MAAVLLHAGPAVAAEKDFGLTSFDAIVLDADFTVEVTTATPIKAVASGSHDALDRVVLDVEDHRLTISQRHFAGDERQGNNVGPVVIRINAMPLRDATVIGAGMLEVDKMRGQTVQLGVRGPGKLIVGDMDADRLSAALIGNGTMTVAGKAKKANFVASGAGVIDAGALSARDLTVDSEGSGDQKFNAERTATITARGVGETLVLGNATCTIRNIGSGSVACGRKK